MKRLVLAAVVTLAACQPKPHDPPKPLEWTSLPDGSKSTVGAITVPSNQIFDGPSAVIRCWPEGDKQDCLIATRATYGYMEFIRTRTPELPTSHRLLFEAPVGYQCVASVADGGWQESVHSAAGQIKLNVVSFMQHPRPASWSKDEVEKLMMDNAIQPQSYWMNCRNLSEVVGKTSLAAVASTEVTRDVIGG